LEADIDCRVKRYSKCLSQCSKNYREWLVDDYKLKMTLLIGKKYREKIMKMDVKRPPAVAVFLLK
jgi:hypothetical protein